MSEIQTLPPKTLLTSAAEAQAVAEGYHGSSPYRSEATGLQDKTLPEPIQAVHSPSEIIANSWKIDSLTEQVDSSLPSEQPDKATASVDVLPDTEKSEILRRGKLGRFVMRILSR